MSFFIRSRKNFLCEIFVLFLSIKGRVTFLQLSRFGDFKEQRYRQQFEIPFPFLNHTAFHLEAVQTLIDGSDTNLTDWYARVVRERKERLCSISRYLVADAWFSKKPFVDQVIDMGMQLISRLRDGADLKYLYHGEPSGKKGRPQKYDGKIDVAHIDKDYFELVALSPKKPYIQLSCIQRH